MFDRIKIFENQILNEDFLFQRLQDLSRGKINLFYIKIDEGADLKKLNIFGISFIDFLTNFCTQNNISKEKIKIEHDNLLQDVSIWPNYIKFYNSDPFLYGKEVDFSYNKQIKKKFGLFVGGSRWHRLWLGSYLYEQHSKDSLISYHQHHFNKEQPANLYIDELMFKMHKSVDVDCLDRVSRFCKVLPLHLENTSSNNNTGYINYDRAYNILNFYNDIFVDIVCETWHEGETFMPTEKTGRCFISKTPFIIYGPKNYLYNLKRIGFKTFEDIFDESYDRHEGAERIFKIKNLIDYIGKKDYKELIEMNKKIISIVEHNFNNYLSLTGEEIIKKFKQ
jgi:hypothetical protein